VTALFLLHFPWEGAIDFSKEEVIELQEAACGGRGKDGRLPSSLGGGRRERGGGEVPLPLPLVREEGKEGKREILRGPLYRRPEGRGRRRCAATPTLAIERGKKENRHPSQLLRGRRETAEHSSLVCRGSGRLYMKGEKETSLSASRIWKEEKGGEA